MELSRSAGAYSHPPDRQAEALREIARQQATANTWNMIQTGVMAGQLAVQSAIHGQMEQVKQQTADTLDRVAGASIVAEQFLHLVRHVRLECVSGEIDKGKWSVSGVLIGSLSDGAITLWAARLGLPSRTRL